MLNLKSNASVQKLLLLFGLLLMLTSFQSSFNATQSISAGVTIPSNQEFVFGEYAHPDYKSTLTNKSDVTIKIEIRNRETQVLNKVIELASKETLKVNVTKQEMVILKNSSSTEVLIKVRASKNVSGMRYQQLGAYDN